MKMMKKGLFGCDLRAQVFLIGVTYCALSLMGIVFGFMLLQNPERFENSHVMRIDEEIGENNKTINETVGSSTMSTSLFDNSTHIIDSEDANINSEEVSDEKEEDYKIYHVSTEEEYDNDVGPLDNDYSASILEYSNDLDNETRVKRDAENDANSQSNVTEHTEGKENKKDSKSPKEKRHYLRILRYLENEGIEAIIASFLKLACSILLIHGVRSGKHWFLVPWMVEECVEMIGSFFHIMVQIGRSNRWGVGSMLVVIVCYVLGSYFLYSVASYHTLLRRMNKNSDQIISSVSGGFQVGMNYHRLEEDAWQSEPNIASEMGNRGGDSMHKFGRPGMETFMREKKVDLANDNDEHVLYVQ